jgi:glycosyltransferase involved in cell wall biosynthesis
MSRIVILTPYYSPVIGGVETNAARFAQYVRLQDVPVQVVTKRLQRSLPDAETIDGVPVLRLGPYGERSPLGKWLMIPAVFRWLTAHRDEYDAVCVIDYRGVGVAAIAARTLTRHPVLVQAQTAGVLAGRPPQNTSGLAVEGPLVRLAKWPVRFVYRRADALACISRDLEQEARAAGVPTARIHLIPNALDMARFAPAAPEVRAARRASLGLSADRVACLFVGRLSREKGVLDLVEAWRLLGPSPGTLVVAGPDMTGHAWDAGPAARELVRRYGLEDSVTFSGPVTDVPGILGAADLLVQPSHFEAQGLSAVEALACGVPVIASNVGGLPEFVSDGRNGRLVPPGDPPALAAALRELITDVAQRTRLAAAARASVRDYDERVVFKRMLDLIQGLIAPKGAGRR